MRNNPEYSSDANNKGMVWNINVDQDANEPLPQESQPSVQKAPTASQDKCRKEKKIKKINCKRGASIKMIRGNLFHMLPHYQQKAIIATYQNSRNFCRSTLSGNNKVGWNMRFDKLLSDFQEVFVKERNMASSVNLLEEEKECNHKIDEYGKVEGEIRKMISN